jgi:4-hydroxybenzoate polyprenyltransferase
MRELIYNIFIVSRPRLWVKNLALFLPAVIGGNFFDSEVMRNVSLGVISFCFLSSSNYILNDILDTTKDKRHPLKRNRPLAKKLVTMEQAIASAILFAAIGLLMAFYIGQSFFAIALLFVIIHHLSYFYFRKIPVLDVLAIASGYLLRVMAGEQAGGSLMSVWLFLAVLSGSLLLAIGKRRHEYGMMEKLAKENEDVKIEHKLYSEKILDSYVAMFASATFLSYTYFTFLSSPTGSGLLFKGYTDFLIQAIGRKWMMITVPFLLYGIMRYLQLVYRGNEVLAKVVTSDIPIMVTALLWGISLLLVIYGIGG